MLEMNNKLSKLRKNHENLFKCFVKAYLVNTGFIDGIMYV